MPGRGALRDHPRERVLPSTTGPIMPTESEVGGHTVYPFPLDAEAMAEYGRELKLKDQTSVPMALARAIAASPLWGEMAGTTLVVRSSSRPTLAVLGRFNEAEEARLAALARDLNFACAHLRYVSYAQAEGDCNQLAAKLVERFGRSELSRFCFAAIPRGGAVVLGMLAYVLGLERRQLEPPHPADVPLVVVDDCALSGTRFGRFLLNCENHEVIFAHLYSHPDLRAAIEAQEPRVAACLAAGDLRDHGPEHLGKDYAAWRKRWRERLEGPRYWIGQADHICFAWNEPDWRFWNPVTQRVEGGWRIVPPELCLKNRPAAGSKPLSVQVQPEGNGRLRPSEQVLFGESEGQIVIANLDTGQSFGLADVAADMWRAIVKERSLEDAAVSLLRSYDVDEATLRADLRRFADDLLMRGLLEEHDAPHSDE